MYFHLRLAMVPHCAAHAGQLTDTLSYMHTGQFAAVGGRLRASQCNCNDRCCRCFCCTYHGLAVLSCCPLCLQASVLPIIHSCVPTPPCLSSLVTCILKTLCTWGLGGALLNICMFPVGTLQCLARTCWASCCFCKSYKCITLAKVFLSHFVCSSGVASTKSFTCRFSWSNLLPCPAGAGTSPSVLDISVKSWSECNLRTAGAGHPLSSVRPSRCRTWHVHLKDNPTASSRGRTAYRSGVSMGSGWHALRAAALLLLLVCPSTLLAVVSLRPL